MASRSSRAAVAGSSSANGSGGACSSPIARRISSRVAASAWRVSLRASAEPGHLAALLPERRGLLGDDRRGVRIGVRLLGDPSIEHGAQALGLRPCVEDLLLEVGHHLRHVGDRRDRLGRRDHLGRLDRRDRLAHLGRRDDLGRLDRRERLAHLGRLDDLGRRDRLGRLGRGVRGGRLRRGFRAAGGAALSVAWIVTTSCALTSRSGGATASATAASRASMASATSASSSA